MLLEWIFEILWSQESWARYHQIILVWRYFTIQSQFFISRWTLKKLLRLWCISYIISRLYYFPLFFLQEYSFNIGAFNRLILLLNFFIFNQNAFSLILVYLRSTHVFYFDRYHVDLLFEETLSEIINYFWLCLIIWFVSLFLHDLCVFESLIEVKLLRSYIKSGFATAKIQTAH
jgi:hypothetical protein